MFANLPARSGAQHHLRRRMQGLPVFRAFAAHSEPVGDKPTYWDFCESDTVQGDLLRAKRKTTLSCVFLGDAPNLCFPLGFPLAPWKLPTIIGCPKLMGWFRLLKGNLRVPESPSTLCSKVSRSVAIPGAGCGVCMHVSSASLQRSFFLCLA